MLDSDKSYTITIKPSDSEGKWVEREDKYDTLAEAIVTALTMETDTHIPGFLIEEFCDRIIRTLKRWEKELQNPDELFEKHCQKILNSQDSSK